MTWRIKDGWEHRAAIGLTEECDAVAVVVSEERGEISLSLNGRIARGLSTDDLRLRLQALMLPRRRSRASRSSDGSCGSCPASAAA